MKKEIEIPFIGESITTGTLVSWLKNNGDQVAEGEAILELETEKSALEVPSPEAGILEILVEAGTEVAIGQTVARLAQDEEIKADPAPQTEETAAAPEKTEEKSPKPRVQETTVAPEEMVEKVPPAKTPARQAPTSPAPATNSPTRPKDNRRTERVPMSTFRRKTAERLVKATQNSAYLTTFNEIDMQKVIKIRTQYKSDFEKEHGIKIGFMSFFVKACCQALKDFPAVNSEVDGTDIINKYYYDIGVAVSIDEGLLVPIIRDADKRHFADIEAEIGSLAKRAREKHLLPDDLMGGTFTITNGGVFGSLLSTPIPAYPQTAILGMHAIKPRPVVVADEIVVRPMMYVALTYDHRVIDGREAIGFLARVKDFIEEPDKLLLEL